jgi:hypothetical protein
VLVEVGRGLSCGQSPGKKPEPDDKNCKTIRSPHDDYLRVRDLCKKFSGLIAVLRRLRFNPAETHSVFRRCIMAPVMRRCCGDEFLHWPIGAIMYRRMPVCTAGKLSFS